jgi:hypothetical protein
MWWVTSVSFVPMYQDTSTQWWHWRTRFAPVGIGLRSSCWVRLVHPSRRPGSRASLSEEPSSQLISIRLSFNTVFNARTTGTPLVAVAFTNEQRGIAVRVAWVGAGEVIANRQVTPQVLRAAAERGRDAIQVAGGALHAAELIEQRLALRP